ncbi:MAG: hypothetical protein Q4Q23_01500 [Methanobacteriaceae archaeon]|nr:hypothetical protein [Methanobacteriaceae archaeon]
MVNRIEQGYEIYDNNCVTVTHYEDDHIIFTVNSIKTETVYTVSMLYGYWNCDCADYQYRNQKNPGSFYCKHLQAAQFKLYDIIKRSH